MTTAPSYIVPITDTFAPALHEKVALITGASRNLGAAFAKGLADAGARVVLQYHSAASQPDAEYVADTIHRKGGEAICVQADLTELSQIKSMFDAAASAFGSLDIVVNNAGCMHKAPLDQTNEQAFDAVFALNTKAAFFVMKEAAACLRDNGRIINIGTSLLAAFTGNYAAYAGSKAPLEDFTRALACEIGTRGTTVNTICPGPIDTSFLSTAETEETLEWLASASATNRLGRVEDIVPWIVFLSTPAAGWATGQTFFINGGFAAR